AGPGPGGRAGPGGGGLRDRDPSRAPVADLREVLRGRRRHDPPGGRSRRRALSRAGDRAPAQRLGGGAEPAGTGQRVRGPAAAKTARPGQPGPRVKGARAAAAATLLLVLAMASPGAAAPARSPEEAIDRLERAWRDRDAAAYLELWSFASAEARDAERDFVVERFAAEQSFLELQRPSRLPAGDAQGSFKLSAQVFTLTEPRGRVEQWLLT